MFVVIIDGVLCKKVAAKKIFLLIVGLTILILNLSDINLYISHVITEPMFIHIIH